MTLIGSEQVQHGPRIFERRRAASGHTSKKIVAHAWNAFARRLPQLRICPPENSVDLPICPSIATAPSCRGGEHGRNCRDHFGVWRIGKGQARQCGRDGRTGGPASRAPRNACTAVGGAGGASHGHSQAGRRDDTRASVLRPDYAVSVRNALAGFIEVKAPGKGFDPRRFTDEHDKKQWQKLKTLPNLIYTDGNGFTLWQDGELKASVALDGDIETAGARLVAPPSLLGLLTDFLAWSPIAPRNAKQLAGVAARLCRLLREEVTEELERNNRGLTTLSSEWRNLLFPEATNKQFADGYAQAVTFGLLVARVRKIDLADGLDHAATELRKVSGLIGTALRLLVDDENVKTALASALDTLRRVLNVVDWDLVSKGDADAWLYFYEDFLEVYDNDLRKQTGSYYTPPQVVDAMVRLVDEALRDRSLFRKRDGFAAKDVTICDPAVGTGTYLLGVLRQIARSVEVDKGAGAVAAEVEKAASRMFAFEMQFGPFAVAQLRLIAEMQALVGTLIPPIPNLYITDTLGDPYAAETQFSITVEPIAASRKEANRIKREQPITVVIGNPPYKEKAKRRGGWIEGRQDVQALRARRSGAAPPAPMDLWSPPVGWGVGAHAKHLKNL
ncbi:MAG TPA: N-6 DNA methylase, partial [Hyphomicrobiaceae bacterium]|nr:N-6 DNA methylase [Hyphomicrobiaceae bacterium]